MGLGLATQVEDQDPFSAGSGKLGRVRVGGAGGGMRWLFTRMRGR
jgi:hypothetical protein